MTTVPVQNKNLKKGDRVMSKIGLGPATIESVEQIEKDAEGNDYEIKVRYDSNPGELLDFKTVGEDVQHHIVGEEKKEPAASNN